MKPFMTVENASNSYFKRLQIYAKRMRKFGAWLEAEEVGVGKWNVKLFCPVVYTDKMGNSAIKQK